MMRVAAAILLGLIFLAPLPAAAQIIGNSANKNIIYTPTTCDGFRAADGAVTSAAPTAFSSASASFTASDVGKAITIYGAGAAGVALNTTIASVTDAHDVVLTSGNASGTNVSGAIWGYGSDYSSQINAALATGVQLPSRICGIYSSLTPAAKNVLLGQGAGTSQAGATTLMWLGPVGGTMLSADTGAAISGAQIGNFNLDGLCSATNGAVLNGLQGSAVYPIIAYDQTGTGIAVGVSIANNIQNQDNLIYWLEADENDPCAASAKGIAWGGAGTATVNTNHNRLLGVRVLTKNATGFECGNADSNQIAYLFGQQVSGGSGVSLDLLGSSGAAQNCRSNVFSIADPLGGTTNETASTPATNNVIGVLIKESGAPNPVVNGGKLYCMTSKYVSCGNVWKAAYQGSVLNPTGTASTTAVMMGMAGSITPQSSGTVLINLVGEGTNSTSGDGAKVQIRYGTGAAPTNGAALTGTQCGSNVFSPSIASSANAKTAFAVSCVASGLTVGTTYWIDAADAAVTGGTATISDSSINAVEQ